MPTEIMRARLGALLLLLLPPPLLAGGAVLAAAQDTLAPGRLGGAAAESVVVADQVGVGGATVGPNQIVDGDVVSSFGDVRIVGRVRGDVTVGKGNLFLGPGGRIEGGVTVNGGAFTSAGTVSGNVEVSGGAFRNTGKVQGSVEVSGGPFENTGTVAGDAEVSGSTLTNRGTIQGDAEVSGGKLINAGGRVFGEMVALDASAPAAGRREHGGGHDAAGTPRARHDASSLIGDEVGRMGSVLAFALLLAALGAVLIHQAYPRLERVSDEVRRDPVRAGVIGFAASILVLPVAIAAVVGLALTIVGILAIPLVPVAVAALFLFGLLSAAHAVGERIAERSRSFDARYRNGYGHLLAGVGLLLAPLLLAHLLELTGFLGWLGALVEFLAWLLLYLVTIIGTGAVVQTRAGGWLERRRHAGNAAFAPDPLFTDPAGGRARG